MNPELIKAFEDGTLSLYGFDHKQHIYIAWVYLNQMGKEAALEKYCTHLKALLDAGGYGWKFSYSITESYFNKLDSVMSE